MRYTEAKNLCVKVLSNPASRHMVPMFTSAPGVGKTACQVDIARALGFTDHDAETSNIILLRPSLHDPVDFIGVPFVEGGVSDFAPPRTMHQLADTPMFLIIDEISDAVPMMQNVLCGIIYDKRVGNVRFHPETVMAASGNRTQDKSGAQRVVSKLANRLWHIPFEANVDDLAAYFRTHGYDSEHAAFLRFRPGLLHDFNPDRFENPTPRSWEQVAKLPWESLNESELYAAVAGHVGEGAAAERVGFHKIASELESVDYILKNPDKAKVPTDLSALYAVCGAIADRASPENIDAILTYVERIPPEFQTLTVKVAYQVNPAIATSKQWVGWFNTHSNILIG